MNIWLVIATGPSRNRSCGRTCSSGSAARGVGNVSAATRSVGRCHYRAVTRRGPVPLGYPAGFFVPGHRCGLDRSGEGGDRTAPASPRKTAAPSTRRPTRPNARARRPRRRRSARSGGRPSPPAPPATRRPGSPHGAAHRHHREHPRHEGRAAGDRHVAGVYVQPRRRPADRPPDGGGQQNGQRDPHECSHRKCDTGFSTVLTA